MMEVLKELKLDDHDIFLRPDGDVAFEKTQYEMKDDVYEGVYHGIMEETNEVIHCFVFCPQWIQIDDEFRKDRIEQSRRIRLGLL
jgi:hypothetical protein